jgi:hypothetical protein
MIFVELRRTRILTEGDSRFYTQPKVGRWVAPSECASMAPSECASGSFRVCQYSSFRMYQYSSFRMYVDCHVTKSKVQAGAVTANYLQLDKLIPRGLLFPLSILLVNLKEPCNVALCELNIFNFC